MLLPALPIVREPILLALQVGVVVLLPIFVNLVATQFGSARVRLAFVRLVSATLELLEIPLTRLVAVFALGMPLSARLIVALIFHRHLRLTVGGASDMPVAYRVLGAQRRRCFGRCAVGLFRRCFVHPLRSTAVIVDRLARGRARAGNLAGAASRAGRAPGWNRYGGEPGSDCPRMAAMDWRIVRALRE